MQVLDDLGDRSEPDVRKQYFSEIDKDGSGAIDFEEFLAVSKDPHTAPRFIFTLQLQNSVQ